MKKAMFVCLMSMAVSAAPTSTATWDYTKDTGNTTPATAADWFTASNWDVDPAPNGSEWKAVLTGATDMRYISIDRPLTLGALTPTLYDYYYGVKGTVLMSDYPITLDNPDKAYNISGGRIFADIVSESNEGTANATELDGRVNFGNLFYLAGGTAYHRLDRYATSSNPLRTDDFTVKGIYRGSGHIYTTGPRKGTAHDGTWTVTAGSPFVTRTGTTPKIAVGAVVTCGDVFPAGTFVRRVFSDTVIELSAAASASAASGDKTLSFAAITPVTRIAIPELQMCTWVLTSTAWQQPDADGDFRVSVSSLVATASYPMPFAPRITASGMHPATLVIHDAAYRRLNGSDYHLNAQYIQLRLGKCHLEFAETGRDGARSGLPQGAACSEGSVDQTTQITVTNGIDAAIGLVTNFYTTIVKDGGGSLELGLTNDVARNTGTIVVKEGTLVLPEGSWVKTVAVSNGATLKVLGGTFEPEKIILEPGVTLAGDGTVVIQDISLVNRLTYEGNVRVRVKGGSGEVLTAPPTYEVVGDPAFWVDASQTDKMTFAGEGSLEIMRIDDVRKTAADDGYMFATNVVRCPVLVKNGDGTPSHIYFERNTSAASMDEVRELVWDRPITNMYAIFMVVDANPSGRGQFLGSTARLKTAVGGRVSDFVHDPGTGWYGPVFYPGNSGAYQLGVINGPFYLNGIRRHPFRGYLYSGGQVTVRASGNTVYTPQVVESHPLLTAASDCFCTDSSLYNRNGDKRLFEMIVYTNALTYTERVAVCGYLMKKWINCDVNYGVQTNDLLDVVSLTAGPGGGYDVAAGEALYVKGVAGVGTLEKAGDGTMYVETLADANVSVAVSGNGTLDVRSAVATVDGLPSDPVFRMDASRTDLMTTSTVSGVANAVTKWKSAHDGTTQWSKFSNSTNPPVYRSGQLNGMGMVDFGPVRIVPNDHKDTSGFQYTRVNSMRSVFMVENTAQGGTSIVGDTGSWSFNGLMRHGWYLSRNGSTYYYGDFTDPANALVYENGGTRYTCIRGDGARVRRNGEWINTGTAGWTGGNDQLSFVSYVDISSDSFSMNQGYGYYSGGGMLGEYVAYSRGLCDQDALKVEAYLRKKWFNADTPGFMPAVVSNLTVAANATLNVSGGSPITVNGALSGGGTVSGSLVLASTATIDVPVAGQTVQAVTVSGTVDLSNGGTVRLIGDARGLNGDYVLVSCPSLVAGVPSGWTLAFSGAYDSAHSYRLLQADGAFVLRVTPPGTTILFR